MSLRQYEYALAVAEEGSVTAAAELLRVAQPSVSQQIRGLERELGVQLFDRTPTGLVPTVVGRAFLREAEIAVAAARRARATARPTPMSWWASWLSRSRWALPHGSCRAR